MLASGITVPNSTIRGSQLLNSRVPGVHRPILFDSRFYVLEWVRADYAFERIAFAYTGTAHKLRRSWFLARKIIILTAGSPRFIVRAICE